MPWLDAEKIAAAVLVAALGGFTAGQAWAQVDEPIRPIPLDVRLDARKVALGDRLFHDKRLSGDDTIACASCHSLERGGVDGRVSAIGIGGSVGPINVPTVLNSGFNFRQFWDGRAASLEEQAAGPVHNPKEMGSNWSQVIEKLSRDKSLVSAFGESYRDGLKPRNIQDAIAVFERSLTTPNARFDKYLRGDTTALHRDELQGYRLFKSYGCVACHQGVNVGGNMFQKFGVMGDYFMRRGNVTEADLGRYLVTGAEADKHVFKVPTLRNVALTAPYFHDGAARTLEEAVDVMFRYQLGRTASKSDKAAIIAFLNTLTGDQPVLP
jgi:cytochrome c peroxidase